MTESKFPWPQWEPRFRELFAQGKNSTQIANMLREESALHMTDGMVRVAAQRLNLRFGEARPPDEATAEKHRLVTDLWREGLSQRQIAAELSERLQQRITRSAIGGIIDRLNLPKRYNRIAEAAARSIKKPRKASKPPKPGPIALSGHVGYASMTRNPIVPSLPRERLEDKDIPVGQRCTIMELDDSPWNPQKCRWPIGTPGKEGFAFCGGKVSKRDWGSKFKPMRCPYCDEHADRAAAKKAA